MGIGRCSQPRRLLDGFTDCINECQLLDLGYVGNRFTWERARGSDRWIQERLDRGLATRQWMDLFPRAEVIVLDVSTSDHLPLNLQLNRKIFVPRSQRFRFENMWLKEKECLHIVKSCWGEMANQSIMNKIQYCCLKLEEWGGGKGKEFKEKIKEYKQRLKRLRSRRDGYGIRQYNEVRWDYLKLLERQEIYWHQRAKQFWLQYGDQNTNFFHKYAATRRLNNSISRLKDQSGDWKEEEGEIQNIVIQYFDNLFKATTSEETLTPRDVVACVTQEQNNELMKSVQGEEVKEAVFSMKAEKSPGLDGLNPGFYQAFWNIVGDDVTEFCRAFFNTGTLPQNINRTLVCLIPKVKNPTQMTELRPISLCNVLMRIVSKVLANRLKPCLKNLVSDKQSAFIEGRLLVDNALLAYEINHCIKRRTQGKHGLAGLKLDISKAYDRLEWRYVESMLDKFGFNAVWIQRVMTCIKSVTYSFLHNGMVFGEIQPQRGIRQGDPISPYIYILCAEGLSSMLRRNEEVGLLHGVSIARGAPHISHLLFADDCYMFFRANASEAGIVKKVLSRYERVSGQAVNFSKSSIYFSPNTKSQERNEICQKLQVQEVHKPGKYLGMPMSIGKKKVAEFQFLTDKVKQKLQGWSCKKLSKGGKYTLLQTAAQTVPNFWMNLFLIPQEVCENIEVQLNGFWWGNGRGRKGIRWKAWEKLSVIKEAGGLGFRQLRNLNISMLAKQGWRLINNDNPLVTRCMRAKYFPDDNFLSAKIGANPSYMWRSILAAQEIVRKGCRRRIGDGQQTEIWKVPWLPSVENGYLTTPMPDQLAGSKVCGLLQINNKEWDDDVLKDICNERDRSLIKRVPLSRREEVDSWFWLLDEHGCFTVKSCYRAIQGEIETTYAKFWRKIWNLKLPSKIVQFMWRTCSLCLPTAARLITRRVQIDLLCPWCRAAPETDRHILFDCDIAQATWVEAGLQHILSMLTDDNICQLFCQIFDKCSTPQCSQIVLICWSLWNRRNKWVWEKINMSSFGIKAAAANLLVEWRKAQTEKPSEPSHVRAPVTISKWKKPQQHWVKVNIDAALFEDIGCIGMGSVVRGADGQFLMARSMRREGLIPPREAEALCLKEALSWLKGKNFPRCVFETDSQVLARACNGVTGRSYFATIVRDCIELFHHFDEVEVCFTRRSANGVAHALARVASSMSESREWQLNAPEFIHHVISSEAL